MSSYASANPGTQLLSGSCGDQALSIALIGPDGERRGAMVSALADDGRANVTEFESYPSRAEEFRWLLAQPFDVIVLDLDSDMDVALALVERIKAEGTAKVMVYSNRADTKLAVRFMRAGAREYLLLPLEPGMVTEALDRTELVLREKSHSSRQTAGNLLVCLCAKGGSGVTTVACNLAVALARESEQKTLLIDLALPIGDAALALGVTSRYSTEDALRNIERLDARLLQELLVRHKSGAYVLAAPGHVLGLEGCGEAIDKLIALARREFDHVVVDLGSRMDLARTALFKTATTIYLVTLTGVSELRNSKYLISQFFATGGPRLELVVNRFESRLLGGVNEEVVNKALGRPVRWKIPDDREAARELQFGEIGIAETRLAQLSMEMASAVTGRPIPQEKKKAFSLKALGKSLAEEVSGNEDPLRIRIVPPAAAPPAAAPPAVVRATPALTWPTPPPIPYGSALSAAQLNASAPVAGDFQYSPGEGTMLAAGTHTLSVTFAPADSEKYTPAQATVSLHVTRATPEVSWPTPDPIAYGTLLGASQLCARASVPGRFDYSPAPGTPLAAGVHTLSAEFTASDAENYAPVRASVSLRVAKAMPTFDWPTPKPIRLGTPLSVTQLCATASVPGTFDYTPAAGAQLSPGRHTLTATFTPADRANYATAQATVPLTVAAAEMPVITWPAPGPISYGTRLSRAQLCATASVAGKFEYSPAAGETLAAGTHTLSVVFTPNDATRYATAQSTVSLIVNRAPAVIAWAPPAPISYGTRLSATQLGATASIPGRFDYSPALGALLAAGTHTLAVTFTPADSENYAAAQCTVPLEIAKAKPAIAWPAPQPIQSETALSAQQLCATTPVPGTLDYHPGPGTVLSVGVHTLSVLFTPADSANYAPAEASVPLEVMVKPSPAIAWRNPDPIAYGTPLSSSQLCATAPVPGTFDYSPEPGETLSAGTHTLSVAFTPADAARYASARATVSLTVNKATPSIDWPSPEPIKPGTALSDVQLNAMTWIPGTFVYSPGAGEILPPGAHKLSVTFTPSCSANYTPATATVTLKVVAKAKPVIAWSNPDPIASGTRLSSRQLCATASVPGVFDYSPELGEVLAPGRHTLSVSFIPADTEKYRAAQATVVLHVEASPATAPLPATAASREHPKPAAKPLGAREKLESGDSRKQDAEPGKWSYTVHPARPQPIQTKNEVAIEQEEKRAGKTWLVAAAAALGSIALLLLFVVPFFHRGARLPVTPAMQRPPVAADVAAPAIPAPLAHPAQAPHTEQAPHTQQGSQTAPPATPPAPKPTSVDAEMMNEQLHAPTRLPQNAQKQPPSNAAPPASIATAGLGGSGAIGPVFNAPAPQIVMGAPAKRLVISPGVAMGLLMHKTLPIYPAVAKEARISGTVVIDAVISRDGRVETTHAVSGPAMLRQPALDAVRTWRYKPYMVNNQPVAIETTIIVGFALAE